MYKQTAEIITHSIEEIVRSWVDDLRQSARTEIHNQLLSAEIVNGMKAMLATLAEALTAGESPDNEPTRTTPLTTGVLSEPSGENPVQPKARLAGTRPLVSPLARALNLAGENGRHRHDQGYELHELILEYIKLRQCIWLVLQSHVGGNYQITPDLVRMLDRIFDELMLTALENYYNTSVRDLEKRAIHDPLTQLYNKDYFQQRLHQELRRAIRHQEPLTIAMIDMDLLKHVNDTFGHPVGDAVITGMARAIRETGRQTDVPCRYGGDEFAVILPETSKLQGRLFAERLLRHLHNRTIVVAPGERPGSGIAGANGALVREDAPQGAGMPLVIPLPTVSIGVAAFPEDGRNPEMLVARADSALYKSKREGRNRISY